MRYSFDKRKINKKNKFPDSKPAQVKREMLPNSMVRRIMEDPEAEKEADRLSQGITSSTPDDIMQEMGGRLNADFSGVRFHSDVNSMNKSQAMGARAWAQGRDVYFGKGGFSPSVAAHELVHTVQQGAVRGNVSQSMPNGAIQMIPNNEGDEEEIHPDYTLKEPQIEAKLLEIFNSTDMGRKVYQRMEKKLKKMIEKGTKGGRNLPQYSKEYGIKFLAWASGKDYSSKGILTTIMQKNIGDKDAAKDAAYEYEQYIDMLSTRLGNHGLEDIASQVFGGLPLGEDNKRAYDTQMPEEGENSFNPNQIRELTRIQQQIDSAHDAQSAYRIFADYTGNPGGEYKDQYGTKLELPLFKAKLKHMTRVIYDYPELRGNIGNMTTIDPKKTQVMAEQGSGGGYQKITLEYNAHMDREGGEAERTKHRQADQTNRRYNAPNTNYAGTHELGHGLASLLPNTGNKLQNFIDQNTGVNENDIIQTVSEKVLDDREKKELKKYHKNKNINGIQVLKNQIDTKNSHFFENGHTSKYGSTAPVEMFAEAFQDVYANGKDAKKMSMEIVKEYERRQTKLTREKFNKKKKRGFFRKFLDFFKF